MLVGDNRCTYQTIQKELNILSTAIHKIIHEESHMKKSDETYIQFFDIPTCQESKVWVFEDDSTPTIVERQRAMKNVISKDKKHQTQTIKKDQVRRTEGNKSKLHSKHVF
ncbi:UNVERIFIED_CONTAM: hypothetical protein NCL1_37184 [Trichonephila clavipes]